MLAGGEAAQRRRASRSDELRSGEPRAASADAELILALYEAGIKLEVVRERIVEPRRAQPFANVHDLTEHVNKREQGEESYPRRAGRR